MLRAQDVIRQTPRLSTHDGFAVAVAQGHPGCTLVTDDGHLRALAAKHAIEVRGLLWIVEELHDKRVCPAAAVAAALHVLEQDASVRLPRRELLALITRYESAK